MSDSHRPEIDDLALAEQLLRSAPDPANQSYLSFARANMAGPSTETVASYEAALATFDAAVVSGPDVGTMQSDSWMPDAESTRLHLLVSLAVLAARAGQATVATRRREEALAILVGRREKFEQSYLLMQTGLATLRHGGVASARGWIARSLVLKRELGDQIGVTLAVQALAAVELDDNQPARAAEMLGSADVLWHDAGAVPESVPVHINLRRSTETRAREALGPITYQTHYDRGAQRDPVQALAWALRNKVESRATRKAGAGAVLSRRESEIAVLVAQGLTNREIAARLVVAQRTAEGHVERILVKLGFNSRAQIATWVSEQR